MALLLDASTAPVRLDALWHALFAQDPLYRLRAYHDLFKCWRSLASMQPVAGLFAASGTGSPVVGVMGLLC